MNENFDRINISPSIFDLTAHIVQFHLPMIIALGKEPRD